MQDVVTDNRIQAFDRAVVMNACHFSGLALCGLADGVCGPGNSVHVTCVTGLEAALQSLAGYRVLIITDITSVRDTLFRGLDFLVAIRPLCGYQGHRVVVCTDITDPLLLRVIHAAGPSVMVHSGESLTVMRQALRMAREDWSGTLLSPAMTEGMEMTRGLALPPREAGWFISQVEVLNLMATVRLTGVSYRALTRWRSRVARRLHRGNGTSFSVSGRNAATHRIPSSACE